MKFTALLSFLCLAAAVNVASQSVPPQQDASLFSLEVGNLVLTVDSTYGAKASSLSIDGAEFMVTPDMVSSDFLWGATLWPSPQSEWSWNNSNKLVWDHEEYTAKIDGDTMQFTGKETSVDNGDSFYFIKNFWASSVDTTLNMKYSMVNTTGKTIKKALWELTRVPVGGLTFWPTGPGGTWGQLAPATEEINDHTWYERETEDGTNLKFFADGKDGWFAHVDDKGRLYIKTFEDVDQSEFANNEGEIELWVADEYIELENQGPCRDIPDQGQLDYMVKWYLLPLPDDIKVIAGNPALLAYVNWVISDRGTPPTAIESESQLHNIKVYPVPAKDYLTIEPGLLTDYSISLCSVTGAVLFTGRYEGSAQIDLSGFSRGVYLLTIHSKSFTTTKKILKE